MAMKSQTRTPGDRLLIYLPFASHFLRHTVEELFSFAPNYTTLARTMLSFAGYDISTLVLERFRLDGGAMFGSVPKTLWERRIAPDDKNRIQLATRIMLLKGHGHSVAVDLGCGIKFGEKERGIYAIEPLSAAPLGEQLAAARPDLGPLTDIILTHLHFDHAGGITTSAAEGQLALTFPEARVHLQRINFELAQKPGPRERASYLPENVLPLSRAKLNLLNDGEQILPEIIGHVANGHTRGLQWLQIGTGMGAIAYPSDLIPTAHHLAVPYVMGYDLCAETSMNEKEKFLVQAVAERWRVVFEHDVDTAASTVRIDDRGNFTLDELVSI